MSTNKQTAIKDPPRITTWLRRTVCLYFFTYVKPIRLIKLYSWLLLYSFLLNLAVCNAQENTGLSHNISIWYDNHETDTLSWSDGGGDGAYKILQHNRVHGISMSGSKSEHFLLEATSGKRIMLLHPIRAAEVTGEVIIFLAVRSERIGMQLSVRVILPETRDPVTGHPMQMEIQGGVYSSAGRWQKIRVDSVARQLAQKVRVERMNGNTSINAHGAYIDTVMLNAHSGPGRTEIWLDSLEISGAKQAWISDNTESEKAENPSAFQAKMTQINAPVKDTPRDMPPVIQNENFHTQPGFAQTEITEKNALRQPETISPAENTKSDQIPESLRGIPFLPPGETPENPADVRITRGVLTVNGRILFVRAIRHNGESIDFLHKMGFNTIWLRTLPSEEQLKQARHLGMWFISPPPPIDVENDTPISARYDRVLVWDMEQPRPAEPKAGQPREPMLDYTAGRVAHLTHADRILTRPVMGAPYENQRDYSRVYNVILATRNPINSTLDYSSYGYWLRNMKNVVSVETPVWTVIPSQHVSALTAQWAQIKTGLNGAPGILRKSDEPLPDIRAMNIPETLPIEQVRLMMFSAITAQSRALMFESYSRLDASDEETTLRVNTLTLMNLEVMLIEQWLSESALYSTTPSNMPYVVGGILSIPHARLLIPMCLNPGAQYVGGVLAQRQVEFTVPGVPSTYLVWQQTADGLAPIPQKRRSGGVFIQLDEVPDVTSVILAQNPVITTSVSARASRIAPRMAVLMKEIAAARIRSFLQYYETDPIPPDEVYWYENARRFLDGAERQIAQMNYAQGYLFAQRALRPIQLLERRIWASETSNLISPNSIPAAVAFRSIKLLRKWKRQTSSLVTGVNQLPSGEFISVDEFVSSGWKCSRVNKVGVVTAANILEKAAYSGMNGLALEVKASDLDLAPRVLDAAPVRIHSPEMKLGPPGTVFKIEAWVNIPVRIVGSEEGLKITDSATGDVLAQRIMITQGWQKIIVWRVVPDTRPIKLNIELTGYGVAWIDDIRVSPLVPVVDTK